MRVSANKEKGAQLINSYALCLKHGARYGIQEARTQFEEALATLKQVARRDAFASLSAVKRCWPHFR